VAGILPVKDVRLIQKFEGSESDHARDGS